MLLSFCRFGPLFHPHKPRQCGSSSKINSGGNGMSAGRTGPVLGGFEPLLKAAVTCGSLTLLGDVLAQGIQLLGDEKDLKNGSGEFDAARFVRMGSFGLCFYGPFQYCWYNFLGRQFPLKNTAHFATKVTLNQIILGPIVCSASFAWTLVLTGKAREVGDKISSDLMQTLVTGYLSYMSNKQRTATAQ